MASVGLWPYFFLLLLLLKLDTFQTLWTAQWVKLAKYSRVFLQIMNLWISREADTCDCQPWPPTIFALSKIFVKALPSQRSPRKGQNISVFLVNAPQKLKNRNWFLINKKKEKKYICHLKLQDKLPGVMGKSEKAKSPVLLPDIWANRFLQLCVITRS